MPTSPIGQADYLQFKSDLAIVKAQLQSYEEALRTALDVNASIRTELQQARDELKSYKEYSTSSFQNLLLRVETLTQQLQDSDRSVIALQVSFDLAKSAYGRALGTAEKKAAGLERERNFWRGLCAVFAAFAAGATVWAAVK